MKTFHHIVHHLAQKQRIILLLIIWPMFLSANSLQGPYSASTFGHAALAGSSTTWNNPQNVGASDNIFSINILDLVSIGDHTDYLKVSGFGFDLPSDAVITGILAEVQRNDILSKAKDYAVRIVKNDTVKNTDKSLSSSWHASNDYVSYGGLGDLWGETWTASDINSANFGFAIAIKRAGGGLLAISAQVDHIRISVYYTSSTIGLPVGLLSFIAAWRNNLATLNWTTATEINNDYFTIEKTQDMVNFKEVCRIKGAGTSELNTSYTVTDSFPLEGISYYRLKQTDFDGHFEYIGLAKLNFNSEIKKTTISVYPNPTRSNFNIAISNYEGAASVKFTDERGNVIYSSDLNLKERGEINYIKASENLAPGLYFLSIKTDDEETVSRVLKLE